MMRTSLDFYEFRQSRLGENTMNHTEFLFKNEELTAALSADIDHHSAATIREEIDRELYRCRPKKLRLDVSRVNFIDSSGLGLILGRYTKAEEIGCSFVLSNPSAQIEKILRLAGTDRVISIERGSAE